MRPSSSVLARIPTIKFIGGKHPAPALDASVKPHVFSSGILPGGEGAIKVSTLPKKPTPPKPAAVNQTKSYILKPNDKPFDFVSVSELPKRFQPLIFDESEIDVVNGGGADLLI